MTHQDCRCCHLSPSCQVGCSLSPVTSGHLESNFSEAKCRLCNNWWFLQNDQFRMERIGGISRLKQVWGTLGNAAWQVGPPTQSPEGKGDPSSYNRVSVLVPNKSPQWKLRHNLWLHSNNAPINSAFTMFLALC